MKKRGVVVSTKADDGSLRPKVRINGVNDGVPVEMLPLAEMMLDLSFTYKPLKEGDEVWVEFPYDGDTRRPMIVGGAMSNPGGIPNVSGAASGNDPLTPPETEGVPPFPAFDASADFVYDRNGLVMAATADGGGIMMNRNTGAVMFMNAAGDGCVDLPGIMFGSAVGGFDVKTPAMFKLNAVGGIELESAALIKIKGNGGVEINTSALLQLLAASIKADQA